MENRILRIFIALVVSVSVFFMPVTVYATSDIEPPTVAAEIIGELLNIRVSDNDSGVESIFIDGYRFNYRVDGTLKVNAKDNYSNVEYISVYAVDFAGNKSDVVEVENPHYINADNDGNSEPVISPPVESADNNFNDQAAFTPDGTGSVMDNIIQQNGKEFFTITTDEGNVFYIIVDRQSNSENVYLLNAVTEDDLLNLSESSSGASQSSIPIPTTPEPPKQEEPEPEPIPTPEPPKSNSGSMIFVVIAVLAAGGAGYYFKIFKPKQDAEMQTDDLFGEDMEYEDDSDEYDDETEDDYEEYPGCLGEQ